jgi:exodeoxyribonuclease VII small subunit
MAKAKPATIDYNELNRELQALMLQLEQGDLEVDESIKCYERALALVKQLEDYLKTAENRVSVLKANNEG